MNTPQTCRVSQLINLLAIIGAFLVAAWLVWAMYRYTHPLPAASNRANERQAALKQIRQDEGKALTEYDWLDRQKGIVRLPIERAKEITLLEYKNPAALRSNLIARAEKASAAPPAPPPAPNKYD
ncbi:MAG TPA: hypothetical protein VGE41_11975 [Verrucomicrobiae bacterium]|jgi:hypothetical protein